MGKKITSLEELQDEATRLVSTLVPGTSGTLITLSGELGAGKTSFVQAIARALGVTDHITSPTFVLEKIYELPQNAPFKKLVHIDAYRLEKGTDLQALGFDELVKEVTNLVVLEWPEMVRDGLPTPSVSIRIVPESDGTRTMTYV